MTKSAAIQHYISLLHELLLSLHRKTMTVTQYPQVCTVEKYGVEQLFRIATTTNGTLYNLPASI